MIITRDLRGLAALRAANPGAGLVIVAVRRAEVASALDAGADIALAGRPRPAELNARIRALQRRIDAGWTVGPLVLDRAGGAVELDGAALKLSRHELTLLRCLASAPGRVFTKAELLASCWDAGSSSPQSRALERHAARLRRRLGPHGAMLVTVWGIGYRLDAPA